LRKINFRVEEGGTSIEVVNRTVNTGQEANLTNPGDNTVGLVYSDRDIYIF